jgi:hypothetical protein
MCPCGRLPEATTHTSRNRICEVRDLARRGGSLTEPHHHSRDSTLQPELPQVHETLGDRLGMIDMPLEVLDPLKKAGTAAEFDSIALSLCPY